ncbi:carboxypeptidase B2 isoform X2 [Girardinichthys multiradiatus]|uniref:carboxypeptidase B2 isoform X2 n=1 Tax=Girardinichthys multiradiatus TaxID=208333 RepID=UPI001FAC7651|nr:carboxypeptidase B2 isoform X2 [Girardinichthys multiradiatus]
MTTLWVLFIFLNFDLLLKAGHCTESGGQVLSITPNTQEQVEILKNVSTQYQTVLWKPVSPHNIKELTQVHLYVPAKSSETVRNLLQRQNIDHEVMLPNADVIIEMQMRNDSTDPRSGSTFYHRYHTLEDLSLNNRPNKKAMWIDCGIHAREWISPAFCLMFVHYSLSFYNQNPDITQILDNMDVYVMPVMNPDGYKYTWTKNRMWRKNRSSKKNTSCIGVDLNRNFDANWCTIGASPDPCEEIYCGAFPESEPESLAVANFLRSHKDSIQIYLSIHSYSQMLIIPYSCSMDEADNHSDLYEMVKQAAENIRRYYRSVYTYGPGAKTIYLAPGGSDDWAYNIGIKYSFTFELQDRGHYGFLLPPSHIQGACNEALIAVKTIALKVIEKTQTETGPRETV